MLCPQLDYVLDKHVHVLICFGFLLWKMNEKMFLM